jgi:hypothetical protein
LRKGLRTKVKDFDYQKLEDSTQLSLWYQQHNLAKKAKSVSKTDRLKVILEEQEENGS